MNLEHVLAPIVAIVEGTLRTASPEGQAVMVSLNLSVSKPGPRPLRNEQLLRLLFIQHKVPRYILASQPEGPNSPLFTRWEVVQLTVNNGWPSQLRLYLQAKLEDMALGIAGPGTIRTHGFARHAYFSYTLPIRHLMAAGVSEPVTEGGSFYVDVAWEAKAPSLVFQG